MAPGETDEHIRKRRPEPLVETLAGYTGQGVSAMTPGPDSAARADGTFGPECAGLSTSAVTAGRL